MSLGGGARATRDPEVGDASVSRGRTITEADVTQFAALTGDMHPQHIDATWAAGSRFGQRIAHGMLLLSYAVGLVDFDHERVVALRGLERATFKAPVAIGDTVRVESKVQDVTAVDDEHMVVSSAWRIVNQRDRLVARARVDMLWRRVGADPGTNGGPASVPDGFDPLPL